MPDPVDLECELDGLSRGELAAYLGRLVAERDALADAAADAKIKLGRARVRAYKENDYSDREWYSKTTESVAHKERWLRVLNRRKNDVELRLARLKKGANAEVDRLMKQADAGTDRESKEVIFCRVARSVMGEETYASIWAIVDQIRTAAATAAAANEARRGDAGPTGEAEGPVCNHTRDEHVIGK
jgi:hypothetical protein